MLESTVMAYDPATESWTKKADMPTARFGVSACVVDGKIYAIGGCTDGYQSFKRVEVYDPATDSWTRKADMPTQRFALGTCVAAGQVYAIGGLSPTGAEANERYDPVTDSWTKESPLRQKRLGPVVGLVGHRIYAIGGSYPSPTPTMFSVAEEYDLWKVAPPSITMSATRIGDSKLELRWQIEAQIPVWGVVLQESEAPQGPWSDLILDAQSPAVITMTEPMKLYRLRIP
jgi:hypothetical protein